MPSRHVIRQPPLALPVEEEVASTYVREFGSLEAVTFLLGNGGTLSGALTEASICKISDATQVVQRNFCVIGQGNTSRWALLARNGSSASFTLTRLGVQHVAQAYNDDDWLLFVATRPAGAATTARFHLFNYTTQTWNHVNDGSTFADNTPTLSCQFGSATTASSPFQVAAGAGWAYEMTDAQVELLRYLDYWATTSPACGWVLDQDDVTTAVTDFTGGGASQNVRTGTTAVEVIDPPWAGPLPITQDGSAVTLSVAAGTQPQSVNHTLGFGEGYYRLVVVVADGEGSTPTTAVTYDGVTPANGVEKLYSGGNNRITLYYLLDADLPSAAGTYSVQLNGTSWSTGGGITVLSFIGVKQQAPEATNTSEAASGTTISTSVTTLSDEALVIDGAGGSTGGITWLSVGGSQGILADWSDPGMRIGVSSQIKTPAGSTTFTWNVNGTQPRIIHAVAAFAPGP